MYIGHWVYELTGQISFFLIIWRKFDITAYRGIFWVWNFTRYLVWADVSVHFDVKWEKGT